MNKAEELKQRHRFENIPEKWGNKPPSKEQKYIFTESELNEYADEQSREEIKKFAKSLGTRTDPRDYITLAENWIKSNQEGARKFGGKDDEKFWSDKPTQPGHPKYQEGE